jgi:hypothetical protein
MPRCLFCWENHRTSAADSPAFSSASANGRTLTMLMDFYK